jgi:hypothetical protein
MKNFFTFSSRKEKNNLEKKKAAKFDQNSILICSMPTNTSSKENETSNANEDEFIGPLPQEYYGKFG